MKLSKEQVNAVAQDILSKATAKRQEEVKKLTADPEIRKEAERYYSLYSAIPLEYRPYGSTISVEQFINKIVGARLSTQFPTSTEINRKVTLATIDTNNLEELMEKLEKTINIHEK